MSVGVHFARFLIELPVLQTGRTELVSRLGEKWARKATSGEQRQAHDLLRRFSPAIPDKILKELMDFERVRPTTEAPSGPRTPRPTRTSELATPEDALSALEELIYLVQLENYASQISKKELTDWSQNAHTLKFVGGDEPEFGTQAEGYPHWVSVMLGERFDVSPPMWSESSLGPYVVFPAFNDAAHIDARILPNALALNVTTIKSDGLAQIRKMLSSVDYVGKSLKQLVEKQRFASGFSFEPYPAAVYVWRHGLAHQVVPETQLQLLEASLQYFGRKEWRASIILSATAVESILAEMHEEQLKDFPPERATLGELSFILKQRGELKYPSDIEQRINQLNQARIAAFHRSTIHVSMKEAISALMAAVQFFLWHYTS